MRTWMPCLSFEFVFQEVFQKLVYLDNTCWKESEEAYEGKKRLYSLAERAKDTDPSKDYCAAVNQLFKVFNVQALCIASMFKTPLALLGAKPQHAQNAHTVTVTKICQNRGDPISQDSVDTRRMFWHGNAFPRFYDEIFMSPPHRNQIECNPAAVSSTSVKFGSFLGGRGNGELKCWCAGSLGMDKSTGSAWLDLRPHDRWTCLQTIGLGGLGNLGARYRWTCWT